MASYLKALGVLRLVSSQVDRDALGWWDGESFTLESDLDPGGLVDFFLKQYRPTPVVAPWNAGSGFYEGDNTDAMDAILKSSDERFAEYRRTIAAVKQTPEMPPKGLSLSELLHAGNANKQAKLCEEAEALLKDLGAAERIRANGMTPEQLKDEGFQQLEAVAKKIRNKVKKSGGGTKEEIVLACRNGLSDSAVEWIDAAVVLRSGQDPAYPPILGSGGNEGRLDYTNVFMRMLQHLLFERPAVKKGKKTKAATGSDGTALLASALFGSDDGVLVKESCGQFDPGRAGGSNQGPGVETESAVNPWNTVLCTEGAIAWAGGVARRCGVGGRRLATSPFTVEARAVGSGSGADSDDEKARAEVWMPVWRRPATYGELQSMLREGRAEIGRKDADGALEFAEAATALGVDRGIDTFVRYGLLKRRGDSYVATPIGRFPVREWRDTDLLRDLDREIDALAKDKNARVASARRGVEQAIYDFLLLGGAGRLCDVLAAVGRARQLPRIDNKALLRPQWLLAADDGTLEFRIAAALASIQPASREMGGIEANLQGDAGWNGNSFCARLGSVLRRRMLEAERMGAKGSPYYGALSVTPDDAAAFVEGWCDDRRIEELLFALARIRWWETGDTARVLRSRWRRPAVQAPVSTAWALLKHVFAGLKAPGTDDPVRGEPSIVPLLQAGRIGDACEVARRRLSAAGLNPIRMGIESDGDGNRIAAALLLPVWPLDELSKRVLGDREMAAMGGN